MVGFGSVTVLLLAALDGAWGWRVGTRRLYRRSYFDMDDDLGVERRNPQRRFERFALAALYAASIAAGAAVIVGIKR